MKTTLIKCLLTLLLLMPIPALAIEYLWTDAKGRRHFDCGGFVVGGEATVKDLGRGQYRVRGVLVNRRISASSIYQAAQIACGERKEFEPPPQPTEGAEEVE